MTDEVTIPAGMKPWAGGDAAPADWDGGPVYLDWGHGEYETFDDPEFLTWTHVGGAGNDHAYIIAYTPMTPEPAQPRAWLYVARSTHPTYPGREIVSNIRWESAGAWTEIPLYAARPTERGAVECYDAGLLGDGGGGDVDWWQDYIRAELARAHEFYADQFAALTLPVTVAATDSRITKDWCLNMARLEAGQEIGAGMPDHPLRAPEVAATEGIMSAEGSLEEALSNVPKDAFWQVGHDGEGADPSRFKARIFEPMSMDRPADGWGDTPAEAIRAALATQPATGRTMGGEDVKIDAALVEAGLCATPGEAARLIRGGGAYINGERVMSPVLIVRPGDTLAAGKKHSAVFRAALQNGGE